MHDAEATCDRFGPLIWRCAYRILGDYAEAQDCCQDVLCEILQQARPDEAFVCWLTTRRAIDRLRQRKRRKDRLQPGVDVLHVPEHEPGPVETAEFRELVGRLRDELAHLPPQQAEAFWMKSVEGMTYAEIAAQLEIDTNTVGVLIHRAKSRVQQLLGSSRAPT
jgi:RNA polymerase sigma-70 factor (ECF subfamily)